MAYVEAVGNTGFWVTIELLSDFDFKGASRVQVSYQAEHEGNVHNSINYYKAGDEVGELHGYRPRGES